MPLREHESDTIAAIATPIGEGGIGIVRLSGVDAIAIVAKVFRPKNKKTVLSMAGYTAAFGQVVDAFGGVVDEGIVLVMRAPKTYTAEDLVEIQVHGSSAVLAKTLELTLSCGARLAGKGEFTKRAFLNGRMDLVQAEAVLDLIQAKTEQSRRWASCQLGGVFSEKISALKKDLLGVLSQLEASLDFPDDHLETQSYAEILERLSALKASLEGMLKNSDAGILLKRGLRVALMGRTNAGKSSLMNALAKHNRVIVTPLDGTTRDVVEEEIKIRDYPVRLLDTAGIRETENLIEKEGVNRSRKAAESADLILFVVDSSKPCVHEDSTLFSEISGREKIIVLNKSDLSSHFDVKSLGAVQGTLVVSTSCVSGEGIDRLEEAVLRQAFGSLIEISDEVVIGSVRQKEALSKALLAVNQAAEACLSNRSAELIAVDIREALESLALLVGEVLTDDLLDVLFNQFCIGK